MAKLEGTLLPLWSRYVAPAGLAQCTGLQPYLQPGFNPSTAVPFPRGNVTFLVYHCRCSMQMKRLCMHPVLLKWDHIIHSLLHLAFLMYLENNFLSEHLDLLHYF